jgi:hypothetical protein
MHRPPALQSFLDSLEAALKPRVQELPIEREIVATLFGALTRPMPSDPAVSAIDPPSPELLQPALETARSSEEDLQRVARAFEALEPFVPWVRGRTLGSGYPIDLHAVIVGPNGLEPREDAEIGVSLMAPGSAYVDHHHPPPEVYLVLSGGEWRHSADPWFTPGVGGIVYNRPHIVHNMRATDAPLFAFWCLPSASGLFPTF